MVKDLSPRNIAPLYNLLRTSFNTLNHNRRLENRILGLNILFPQDKNAGTQQIKQSRAARQVSKMLLEMNSDGEDKATLQRFVSRRNSAPKGGDSDDDDYGLRPKNTAGSSCKKKAAVETAADETAASDL